jgi:hypothetical protein
VYNRKYRNSAPFVMTAVVALLFQSSMASAQQTKPASSFSAGAEPSAVQQNVPPKAQNAEGAVERVVKRFGIGVEGGIALDPELIAFGAHATFGPIFRPNLQFRPGVEFGLGEVTTAFGINLDVLYTLPGASGQARWRPYVGAGPNFSLSHRGFDSTIDEDGNRFDFGDTDFEAGFNFIAGVRNPNRTFLEMRATAYGVSNVRLLVGFAF